MRNLVATTYRWNRDIIKIAVPKGSYNGLMFSEDFCTGKISQAINEHAKPYISMQQDYNRNNDVGIYDLPQSLIYGQYQSTIPYNNKLIVCDFPRKTIYSIKDEYPVGQQHFSWFLTNSKPEKIQFLLSKNLLLVYDMIGKQSWSFKEVFGTLDYEEICTIYKYCEKVFWERSSLDLPTEYLKNLSLLKFKNLYIIPTILKNYQFIIYENNNVKLLEFFEKLLETGIIKTEIEMNGWIDLLITNLDNFYDKASIEDKKELDKTLTKTKIEITKYIQRRCFEHKIISKINIF